MTSLTQLLISTYDAMRREGVNSNDYLQWNFVFILSPLLLQPFVSELKAVGFTIQQVYKNEERKWILHAQFVETMKTENFLHRSYLPMADYTDVVLYEQATPQGKPQQRKTKKTAGLVSYSTSLVESF